MADLRLLSKREAAKLLGVSRGVTLEDWIANGTIKVVRTVSGRVKIPYAEIERIGTQGAPITVPKASVRIKRIPIAKQTAAEVDADLKAMGF
jgi:excisionase family DNA binding protein